MRRLAFSLVVTDNLSLFNEKIRSEMYDALSLAGATMPLERAQTTEAPCIAIAPQTLVTWALTGQDNSRQ